MSRSAEFAAGTGADPETPYTVVSFHGAEKPRMKVRGRYSYDEDAAAAASEIASNDRTAWPNQDYPSTHAQHGEYSSAGWAHGNKMAAVYLKGSARYRA
jgi:hypothetical protein